MTDERYTQEIAVAADAMVRVFGSNEIDGYFAAFHPDATFIFYNAPVRLESRDEYRAERERWEREDGFRIVGCTSYDQKIQIFGGVGVFSHRVVTRLGSNSGEETVYERETIVFERQQDGTWLGVHEHLSEDPRGAQH